MWKQKIGISLAVSYPLPINEVIDIIADAKFDAVTPAWVGAEQLCELVAHARERGLEIAALHAPFNKSADMWGEDSALARAAVEELILAVETSAKLNIPVLVCHTWIGFAYTEKPNGRGIENYSAVVDRARELGVKIAFENTEGEEFLFALMEHFRGDATVGFCWDSGHEMCYNRSQDLLLKFGDVLAMTHLNDNLGVSRFDGTTFWTDDLHLLPFDGIADWQYNVERQKRSAPQRILNLELCISSKPNRHENDVYSDMKLEAFFAEAYKRAARIASAYLR